MAVKGIVKIGNVPHLAEAYELYPRSQGRSWAETACGLFPKRFFAYMTVGALPTKLCGECADIAAGARRPSESLTLRVQIDGVEKAVQSLHRRAEREGWTLLRIQGEAEKAARKLVAGARLWP